MFWADAHNLEKAANEIKERVYQEYVLSDEYIQKQIELTNSLNQQYNEKQISNKEYQNQISYFASKQHAYDLLETTEYNFLKNEYARANDLQKQSDAKNNVAQACTTVALGVGCAGLIAGMALTFASNNEEKKLTPEAQEKSHEICQKVLNKNPEIEK